MSQLPASVAAPAENTNRDAVRKPSQTGSQVSGTPFHLLHSLPPPARECHPPSFLRLDPFFLHELFSGRTGGLSGSAAIKRVSALKTVRPLFRLCSVKSSMNNNSHLCRLIKLASLTPRSW